MKTKTAYTLAALLTAVLLTISFSTRADGWPSPPPSHPIYCFPIPGGVMCS